MRTLKRIIFPAFLFAFISLFVGHELVNCCHHEKGKIENTASGSGSGGFCSSETSAEEDVSFFELYYTTQSIHTGAENISSFYSVLPLKPYYSIWLPPDNS